MNRQNNIVKKAKAELNKRFNRLVGTSATNLCTHCGWCIDACHVFLATEDPAKSPVAKAERVRKVYKYEKDWLSKLSKWWTGAKDLTEEDLDEWLNAAFRDCTLCERCVINCPMGVETPQILAAARGILSAVDRSPEILVVLSDMAISKGEDLDNFRDDFKSGMKRLEEAVRERLNDPLARIPLEEEADILYVPLSGAHTIIPAAMIFNAAGASWTMSMFEASNYGVFLADIPRAKKIVQRIYEEAKQLNVKEIVVTECGHAYGVLKWEAPKWFGTDHGFKVRSVLEVYDKYVREGIIAVDPNANQDPVTYHDPCNMGRKGGIFEEPRRLIKASSIDYREMTPNRVNNYCCGAGGGMVACEEFSRERLLYGKVKAEQIRKTGARKVVTACDNCLHQIKELGEHYGIDITVSNVSEHLANSLEVKARDLYKSQDRRHQQRLMANQ